MVALSKDPALRKKILDELTKIGRTLGVPPPSTRADNPSI